jgi:threonine dehydratase
VAPSSPTFQDILHAHERIRSEIVRTPCAISRRLDDLVDCRIALKLENQQRTGSFKDRGALNRLLHLTDDERSRGVVTASAGNHAQALAFHATRHGIPATVVMPELTPFIKVSNTERFGAKIVLHGATLDDAMVEVNRLCESEGLVLIHAFDDPQVIAGQGTIGIEVVEQQPTVSTIVVPIGGGGIISGIALSLRELRPEVRIIGVEAASAASARASLDAGEVVRLAGAETIADGIAVKQIGEYTFPLIRDLVDDVVTVDEEEIASAILVLLEREKTVVEGAGATPLAALLSGKIKVSSDDLVVPVICGGNIDVNMISRIIERGLVFDGRLARLMLKVRDRPGGLAFLTRTAASLGANVLDIHHRRAFADITVGDVEIVMHLETRGREHVEEIIRAFQAQGLSVEEDV